MELLENWKHFESLRQARLKNIILLIPLSYRLRIACNSCKWDCSASCRISTATFQNKGKKIINPLTFEGVANVEHPLIMYILTDLQYLNSIT